VSPALSFSKNGGDDGTGTRSVAVILKKERRGSVDVPYARCHNFQQVTVWITEVRRFASIFPVFCNSIEMPCSFSIPKQVNHNERSQTRCELQRGVRTSRSAFLEQQQHAAITRTHRAKARLIVQGFAGFERLKAEYSAIEFSGASSTLDVQ
jgi:hypothetical protein